MEVNMKSIAMAVAAFLAAIFVSTAASASTTYVIRKGDNPQTIGKKFKVNPREIIHVNGLKPDSLRPGTRITIPNKRETLRKGKSARSKKVAESKNKKIAEGGVRSAGHREDTSFHKVKKGETLSAIARKYSVSVACLKELNNLRSTRLRPGQKITIKRVGPKTYTVRRDDNIYRIAKRFDMDVDDLREINGLDAADVLKTGQKLLLESEPATDNAKNYDAILSQSHVEKELENTSESGELSKLGLQERLILFAKKMIDIPYRFGGNSLFGIDCSAYVKKVYGLIGINLPRSAREQFREGKSVDGDELSTGDLVFFRTYASFPSHVGIYLGNNLFIHASSRSRKVTIDNLETPYYLKRFIGAKRFIDLKTEREEHPDEG
jgi:peptidoglycan endopeptidase LytE